jgi:hypothetical protein
MEFVGQEPARERKREARRAATATATAAEPVADGARIIVFPGTRARAHRRLWAAFRRSLRPARRKAAVQPEGLRVYHPGHDTGEPPGEVASKS